MLTDIRIRNYYSAVQRYWQNRLDTASYNLDQQFAQFAIGQLDKAISRDDTDANRALFDAENANYEAYRAVVARVRAGITEQELADAALEKFRASKAARWAVLPDPEWLTNIISSEAATAEGQIRANYEKVGDDNSELALIVATDLIEYASDFKTRVYDWIEQNRAAEEQFEFSGRDPAPASNTLESIGLFSDGQYGDEINRVSPEGYLYGDTTWIQQVVHKYYWNGGSWKRIPDAIDQATSVTLLPQGEQEPGATFRVIDSLNPDGSTNWKYFYWDTETQAWTLITWYAPVEGGSQYLPPSGFKKGEGREVIERDVPVMWRGGDGWGRYRISTLEDDLGVISTVQMYGDTLASLTPKIELVYISPIELALRPVESDFEYTTINGMQIDSSKRTSVYSFAPVLDWWDATKTFSTSLVQHSTDEVPEQYWVYFANKSDCFNLSTYDFRGRLFCSKTIPTNGRMGKGTTDAYNAIAVGRCQTAVPDLLSDRVEFLNELDVSSISKVADMKETFREFSDFDLVFVDENTLRLQRTSGTAGQIFVGGRLYFIGESMDLDIGDTRILVDGNGLLTFDYSQIDPGLFYVYMSSDTDIYNDNEINQDTNRPWHPEDVGAGDGIAGPYYLTKDLRLRMFLSTKGPEEGRLSETWRGFWCRLIGTVEVDTARKFKYSASISSIRQMVLNPTFFDGLAEIAIEPISAEEFRVIRAPGTSGIIMVGGKGIQLYRTGSTDPMVHKCRYDDKAYTFTGSETNPLTWNGSYLGEYRTSFAYLYLTNDNPVWDSLFSAQGRVRNSGTGCLFVATNPPNDAYLSSSYPGNTARWICTLGMDSAGKFSGSYIAENLKQPSGNSAVPTGTILDFAGPTCPNGFLVCDGSWYYPAQYPNLWAAIGGYWGWNGSKFAVPNLADRCLIGRGTWALGTQNIGEMNHTLTSGEVPYHDHNHTHSHTHGVTSEGYINAQYNIPPYKFGLYATRGYNTGESANVYGLTTDSTPNSSSPFGGSGAHNNMQPSAVVLKIIRY